MSRLRLNDEIVVPFREFYGKVVDQMPGLIDDERLPISVARLMQRRLEVLAGSSDSVRNSWINNYFFTGDGVFYHPDGRVKVAISPQIMRELTPESELRLGALVLPDGMYDSIKGEEFTRDHVEQFTIDPFEQYPEARFSLHATKENPVWLALAQGDQNLLDEYADAMFSLIKKLKNEDTAMIVSLDRTERDLAIGRLWLIGNNNDSNFTAIGYSGLEDRYNRLVGIAPETLAAHEK